MDKKIWPDYETESAAMRKALGITRAPISASEFLRRRPALTIPRQQMGVAATCVPIAPLIPAKEHAGLRRWFLSLLGLGVLATVLTLILALH